MVEISELTVLTAPKCKQPLGPIFITPNMNSWLLIFGVVYTGTNTDVPGSTHLHTWVALALVRQGAKKTGGRYTAGGRVPSLTLPITGGGRSDVATIREGHVPGGGGGRRTAVSCAKERESKIRRTRPIPLLYKQKQVVARWQYSRSTSKSTIQASNGRRKKHIRYR